MRKIKQFILTLELAGERFACTEDITGMPRMLCTQAARIADACRLCTPAMQWNVEKGGMQCSKTYNEIFIFTLKTFIFRVKICICKVKIYNLTVKTNKLRVKIKIAYNPKQDSIQPKERLHRMLGCMACCGSGCFRAG